MMGQELPTSTYRSISPPPLRRPAPPELSRSVLKCVPSPVSLTTTPKLAASNNVDTVSLSDILSDPLIKECWNFNYLHDVDYVMCEFFGHRNFWLPTYLRTGATLMKMCGNS